MEYPFGLDISEYQGVIKWPVIVSHSPIVHFVYIRAGQFMSNLDRRFDDNWDAAKDASRVRTDQGQDPLLRGAYWVPSPEFSGYTQAQKCVAEMNGDFGELPVAMDLELKYYFEPEQFHKMIDDFSRCIKQYTGRDAIIYSTIAWIKQFLSPDIVPWEGLKRYRFWIAQWLNSGAEAPGRIDSLKGLPSSNILFHQTACSPYPFGVSSKKLDFDRFLGTIDELHTIFQVTPVTTPTVTTEQKIDKLWNWYLENHNA